ncbi:hypothetical protein EON66_01670 [archaeon]|nr:MAG: hypothetical protein EON66_01670 [archaeon]
MLPAAGGLLQMDGHDPERAWMSDLSPSAAMPPRNSSVPTSLIAGASIDGARAVRRDSYASAADIVELHTAAVPLSIPMATLVRILSWCFSGSTHTAMQYIVHDRDEVHVHSSDRTWMLPVPSAQAAPPSGGGRPGSGSVLRALRVRCDNDNILSSLVEGTCALCHTCAPPTTHCMQACGAAERENQCKGSGSHSTALLPQHRQVSGLGSCSCSACRRALQTARSPRSPCSRAAAMYSLFVAGLAVGVLYYPWLCLLGMYAGFFIRVVALAVRHHSTHARKRVYEGVAGAHAALCGLVSRAASWPLLRLPPLDAAASPPPRNAVNLLRYHHIVLLLYLPVLGCKAMALLHAVETLTILPERHWTEFVLVVPMMLHMLVAREHLPFTTLPAAHTHTVACIPYCRPIRRRVCAPLRALLSFFTSLVFLVCCAGWLTFSRAHAAAYHLPSLVSFVSSCILMSHFPLALLCARPTCGAH